MAYRHYMATGKKQMFAHPHGPQKFCEGGGFIFFLDKKSLKQILCKKNCVIFYDVRPESKRVMFPISDLDFKIHEGGNFFFFDNFFFDNLFLY